MQARIYHFQIKSRIEGKQILCKMSSRSDQEFSKSLLLHKIDKVLALICDKDYKSKSCKDLIFTLLDSSLIWNLK